MKTKIGAIVHRRFEGYTVGQNFCWHYDESLQEFKDRVKYDAENRYYAITPKSVRIVWIVVSSKLLEGVENEGII